MFKKQNSIERERGRKMIGIKDMEMPKCCLWDCPLAREDGGACQLADVHTSEEERSKDCPLVEIEERKVGKWIRVDHTKVKCSNCDITHLIAQYPHGVIDYCPNCGSYNQSIIENER